MTDVYRVQFEMVGTTFLKLYCNADPAFYSHVTQLVPNSQIPDEHWHQVTGPETGNPWDQYNRLREWEATDKKFVRNVRLEKMTVNPEWTEVPPK
jgi:hypothetical protein